MRPHPQCSTLANIGHMAYRCGNLLQNDQIFGFSSQNE
ncbi:hypothetical protein B194_3343 [Serratia plymuthica A30]|nr:hypothetical protein B194_3343 [Serratia plymuthica A30]